jgi:hypothetical protein
MAKAGATVASNPAEVASQSGTIVTMLPNNDIVKAVYTGKDGIFQYVHLQLFITHHLTPELFFKGDCSLDPFSWTHPLSIRPFPPCSSNKPMRKAPSSWTPLCLEVSQLKFCLAENNLKILTKV